jgi:hypothetical protein
MPLLPHLIVSRVDRRLTDAWPRRRTGHLSGWQVAVRGIAVSAPGVTLLILGHAVHQRLASMFSNLAGLLILLGVVLVTSRSKIGQMKHFEERVSLWSAWWSVAAGALIITAAVGTAAVTGDNTVGQRIGAAGFDVLLYSPGVALAVYFAAAAVIKAGRRTVIVASAVLFICFLFLPPLIVILANYQWPTRYLLGPQSSGGLVDLLALVPPITLIVVPEMMRNGEWKWKNVKEPVRKFILGWLTRIAIIATCAYAVLLHFWAGPLTGTPVHEIASAILAVGLYQIYRSVAMSCWRSGIADTILHDWWANERKMADEVRNLSKRRNK